MDAILKRRSIKKYQQKEVPWDAIATVVQTARFAPCAGNIFNVRCLVIKDEGQRSAIAEACHQQFWMQDAPIHVVIVTETLKQERLYGSSKGRIYSHHNAAAATENILLAATAMGLGSCWVGAFDEDQMRKICTLPPHIDPQLVITLGYAAEHPSMPQKRSIEDMINFGGFHGRIESPKTGIGDWAPRMHMYRSKAKAGVEKGSKKLGEKLTKAVKKQIKKVKSKPMYILKKKKKE